MLQYSIVRFDPAYSSAEVRFWTPEFPEGLVYAIDIPVVDGSYIDGEELQNHILAFAPVAQLAHLAALKSAPPAVPAVLQIPQPETPLPPDPILDATLADAKLYAENAIDRSAGAARARFISTGPGQDGVYMVKGQQAEAFAAAGFTGPVPSYVAKEAEMLGITPQAAAESMLQTRDIWINQIDPLIEGTRISGKKRVREAATVQQVDQILREVNLALQAIRP